MTNKLNELLGSEFAWEKDWNGYSVYDVVYDRKLADHAVFNSILKKNKRNIKN